MSRRDNLKRIFVGNLPADVRTRDIEDLFYRFGKIAFIDLKTRRGPPFAFVEFSDYRNAEEAVRARDGKKYDGQILRVEFPRGRERTKYRHGSNSGPGGNGDVGASRGGGGGGGGRNAAPQRRSKHRVTVRGLPPSGSWQDLKDHMREIGEVCFADVYEGGKGVVEFLNYADMRYAIKKLNNTKFRSHEGESSYITLREDSSRGASRSRSRSPVGRRRGSPSYSPANQRRGSYSPAANRRRPSHSRSRSRSRSQSKSRSPVPSRRSHTKRYSRRGRSESKSPSNNRSRSRSKSPSKSASRSRSATPRSARNSEQSRSPSHSRGGSPRSSRASSRDSRPKSKSPAPHSSRTPSPHNSDKAGSKSASRSPSPSSSMKNI